MLEVRTRVWGLSMLVGVGVIRRTLCRTFLMLIRLGLVGRMQGLPQIARQQQTLLGLLLHTCCRLLWMTRLTLHVQVGLHVVMVGPADVSSSERLLLRRRFLLPSAAWLVAVFRMNLWVTRLTVV